MVSKKEKECEWGALAQTFDSTPAPPPFLPPCQDINSHKSEKITMHECKKHDQE